MELTQVKTSLPRVGEVAEESSISAVSWPAVFAGAVVAAAFGLILLALGAGIGLASVSPWGGSMSATAFTVYGAIWLIIVQWVSSGLGGYVTGRLRTKWVGVHTQEVFFRDTAHGLLAWAVAVVIGAGVLASASVSILGGQPSSTPGSSSPIGGVQEYYADSLFRGAAPASNLADARADALNIMNESARSRTLTDPDRSYLGRLVAARTGLSQPDAAKRVDDVVNRETAAADSARKAASAASIFSFFSLLIGAFIACVAAAIGGRERDLV
jgi:hypothetical protein